MFVARRPEPPKRLGPPAGHLSMDVSDIMDHATKKTKTREATFELSEL
jgi:hypothetical protein